MKLRQKLAMVLAATMVVTAVPVVTMAASTNRVTKTQTVAKDGNFDTQLIIKLEDAITSGSTFFLEIEGGKFTKVDIVGDAKVEDVTTDGTAVVTVHDNYAAGTILTFDIEGKATAAETILKVVPENTVLTAGSYIVARTNEAKAVVSVGDAKTFYTAGSIPKFTFEEAYVGAFAEGKKITFQIEHDDFEFNNDVEPSFLKGFVGTGIEADFVVDAKDPQIATLTITKAASNQTARGTITLDGLTVKATTKSPELGDLNITVAGDLATEKTHKVANVADYGITLKIKDDKAVAINEGHTGKVTVTLAEVIKDSMSFGSRTVTFSLDNGHFVADKDGYPQFTDATKTEKWEVSKLNSDKNEFEVRFKDQGEGANSFSLADLVVCAPLQAEGTMTLKAEGRAIGDALEVQIVEVKDVVDVETDSMTVKVGLKEQKGGKVVLTEKEKGMFAKGEQIVLQLENESGLSFLANSAKVKVTSGDLMLGDVKMTTGGQITIDVKRSSKEASTIEITEIGVKLDRTVPQGKYELRIGGTGLSNDGHGLTVADFFIVGTPNTEDITNGMRTGTATFTNGATTYTVNGEAKEMDAAAYISKAGRMMLPVRYVSEAFGIEGNNVIFADGTVTILAGTRTLQLKNGSDIALLNGASIKMAEKVVIKDGRTYVPVGEVGRLLGVSVSFDDATKTATFTNK